MKYALAISLMAATAGLTMAASASGLKATDWLQNAVSFGHRSTETYLLRVESNDDDHESLRHQSGDDHENESCEVDDDDDEDENEGGAGCTGGMLISPPAGSIAPPSNGLFGDGKAPTVQSN